MAKIFKGDVNFGFVINQTGAQPLDSRSVVQNYAELLKSETFGTAIYNGMTVATIDEQKVYMLVDKTKATLDEGWKEIGSGSGSLAISAFTITTEDKIAEATAENIGQIIYVTSGTESYPAGPYIVIADGEVSKLGTTTATGDIAGDVEALKTRVSTIENDYVTETELTEAINGIVIPEVPVKDVKYGENTLLVGNGIADLSDFAKTSDLNAYVTKEGYISYTEDEKTKLDGIEDGAEVNVIEKVQVNGVDLTVADKAVNIDLTNYVTKDGNKVLSDENYTTEEKEKLAGIKEGAEVNYVKSVGDNLNVDENGKLTVTIPEVEVPFQSVAENDKALTLNDGVLSSTLTYTRESVEGVDSLVLKGVNNEVIGSVPVAEFVADGMLDSVTPVEGTNEFLFTFKTGNGTTQEFKVDFSNYVDTYRADGETIELGANNTFNVKANVFDSYGAASTAEQNAKNYADTELAKKADKELFEIVSGKVDTNETNIETLTELIGNRTEGDSKSVFEKLSELANGKADKATTLAGYGITDAYTKDEADGKFLTGITVDTELNGTSTNPVENRAVYAEIEAVRDEISNVVAGDLSDALKAYVKSADVNTINDVALYNEGGAVKVEIAAGNGVEVTTDTNAKTITVSPKISNDAKNALSVDENGLFVQAITIEGDDIELENSQA